MAAQLVLLQKFLEFSNPQEKEMCLCGAFTALLKDPESSGAKGEMYPEIRCACNAIRAYTWTTQPFLIYGEGQGGSLIRL